MSVGQTVAIISACLALFACSSDTGSSKCGPGTLGTSCQASSDCKCALQCYSGTCLETPLSTGGDSGTDDVDPGDADGNSSADAGTPGPAADAVTTGSGSGSDTSGDEDAQVTSGGTSGATGDDSDAGSGTSGATGDDSDAGSGTTTGDDSDAGGANTAGGDMSEPDMSEPDMSEPDMSEPDMSEPDVIEPDANETDLGESCATDGGGGGELLCQGASLPTGKGKAFSGLSYTAEKTGTTYDFTCTKCPGGKALIDGSYRYFDKDPSLVNFDSQDVMNFVGNVFSIKKNLGNTIGTIFGYYFCADHNELWDFAVPKYFNTLMVFELTAPPGAWNTAKPGFVNNCYLNPTNNGNIVELFCNPIWNPGAGLGPVMTYCKIGSIIDGKECVDPF